MDKAKVVLTGFMGTGKTTVGRSLAHRLGFDFVDTDEMIVQRDGREIADLFREDGEEMFREWESSIARELARSRGVVIATGGGLMLEIDNAALLSEDAYVFCLQATPEEIVTRLAKEKGVRPLLNVADPASRIRELLESRAERYRQFIQISTSGRSVDEIVEEIVRCISVT